MRARLRAWSRLGRGRAAPLRQPNPGRRPDRPLRSVVVVSPHLDDAVLSCWSILAGAGEVDVVTVFTAGPGDGRVTEWDADSGVSSAERMSQRSLENDAALATLGRVATNLDLVSAAYGGGLVPGDLLRDVLGEASVVYAPAGAGLGDGHPEHVVVREACLAVRPDARLYADNPYCGFREDAALPAGLPGSYEASVVRLSPEERGRKAATIRCYAGELAKLERIHGPITDPDRLRAEVFWTRT